MTTKVIGESVKQLVDDYANAITENYKRYHINTLNRNLHGNYPDYAREQLAEIENGTANLMKFKVYSGKKYYKIIQCDFRNGEYQSGSVTAFVDKKTGQVYKPASWKSPAKHVRFDMRIINERNYIHNPKNTDWAGGHLYMR